MDEYIYSNNSLFKDYKAEKSAISLWGPINKINILVGSNNSGKSRFLRELATEPHYVITEISIEILLTKIQSSLENLAQASINNTNWNYSITYPSKDILQNYFLKNKLLVDKDLNSKSLFLELNHGHVKNFIDANNKLLTASLDESSFNEHKKMFLTLFVIKDWLGDNNFMAEQGFRVRNTSEYGGIRQCLFEIENLLKPIGQNKIYEYYSPNSILIPPLRSTISLFPNYGIEPPSKLDSDIFLGTYHVHYFKNNNPKEKLQVFTGAKLYDKILEIRNEFEQKRKSIEEFCLFMSENFFEGQKVDLVARFKKGGKAIDENIIVKIGNQERQMHDLGDGIQSVILLMFPIFTAENNSWFFIEEPEIHLHPKLQRVFIDTLTYNEYLNSKELKFFITTHSNHMTDDVIGNNDELAIFNFQQKINTDGSEYKSVSKVSRGDVEILNSLGVLNSSVFQANCTIWVEGPTDRIYLKKLLNLYYKSDEFKYKPYSEDVNFAFFLYGGGLIANYIFGKKIDDDLVQEIKKIKAHFLSKKILLLADYDLSITDSPGVKGAKTKRQKTLGEVISPHFSYLNTQPCVEIENIVFSQSVFKKLQPLLLPNLNAIEVSSYNNEQLKTNRLGTLFSSSTSLKKTIAVPSGTLNNYYKEKFANVFWASEDVKWEDLNDEARELTRKVYSFIKSANS